MRQQLLRVPLGELFETLTTLLAEHQHIVTVAPEYQPPDVGGDRVTGYLVVVQQQVPREDDR